ncbi:MAG: NYN domain-containing protein [Patescibacteria group bacterium]
MRAKQDDKKGQQMRSNQQKLFAKLRKEGWIIKYGYLLNTSGKYHEKGVDVQIATDILIGAYENLYDTAILISSDTDLIPALAKAREMKKKVEYVGFSHKPSYGLITHSDIRRLLTSDDIEKFL